MIMYVNNIYKSYMNKNINDIDDTYSDTDEDFLYIKICNNKIIQLIKERMIIPFLTYNLNIDISEKILKYFMVDNSFHLEIYNKYKLIESDNINTGDQITNVNLENKDLIKISYYPNSLKYYNNYPEIYGHHYGLFIKKNNNLSEIINNNIYNINLKRVFVIKCNNIKSYLDYYNEDHATDQCQPMFFETPPY